MVKFISYSGEYPVLCFGTLVIEVDGKEYKLREVLQSGGSVSFNKNWEEMVTKGAWTIDEQELPDELKPLKEEIEAVVNKNVPQGCCGGCV